MNDRWVVNIIGAPNQAYEISIVRDSETLAKQCYGWFDENKVLISEGLIGVSFRVWSAMIELADNEAINLNSEEVTNGH